MAELTGVNMKSGERAKQAILGWYGHIMRMKEGRCARMILNLVYHEREQEEDRKKVGLNEAVRSRAHDIEHAEMCIDDRTSWRRLYKAATTCSMRVLQHTVNRKSCCRGCLFCDVTFLSWKSFNGSGRCVNGGRRYSSFVLPPRKVGNGRIG